MPKIPNIKTLQLGWQRLTDREKTFKKRGILRMKQAGQTMVAAAILLSTVSSAGIMASLGGTAFAVAEPTPVNLHAFTGGNSIAILWNPAVGSTPTGYNVYRNGVLKATVSPTPSTINGSGITTQRYYDSTVVNGTAYTYQVSSLNAAAEESALTATLPVTQPASPVVVPTITIDAAVPAAFLPYLNDVKTNLQVWYPKMVTKLGSPAGTPTAITLKTTTSGSNPAFTSGTAITFLQSWVTTNQNTPPGWGVPLHEAMHVAQLGSGVTQYTPWAHEGMASHTDNWWYNNQVITINNATANWSNGYGDVSFFLNWVNVTYSKPNFVKDFDASFDATSNKYNPAFFKAQTNLSLGENWRVMTGRKLSSVMTFKTAATGFCLDMPAGATAPGTRPDIYTCNSDTSQQFQYIPDSNTSNQGIITPLAPGGGNMCFDVQSSGVTDGTPIWLVSCNSSAAQKWVIQANGRLMNPNSGKCMQPVADGTALLTKLEISTCDTGTNQVWGNYPLGQLRSFNGSGCADVAGSGTTPGTHAQLYSCNDGFTSQQWEFVPSAVGSNIGAVKALGQCLNPVGGGTTSGTLIEMNTCTGANAQKWQWQADNTVKNTNSGLCLNDPAWVSGTQLTLISCASPTNMQKWVYPTL
jgi:hypothetical protein